MFRYSVTRLLATRSHHEVLEVAQTATKVLILTEGGKGIGFGHITRCMSLYQAFKERGIVSTICVNGDDTVRPLLRESKYSILNWINNEQEILELVKGFNIVMIDSYLAQRTLYENVSELVSCPVYLDDNMRIEYPKGIIVNGAIYGKELNYPNREVATFMLGSRYMLLRKEFWSVPKKEVRNTMESVVITFGGDDMRDMTPRVLGCLVDQFPDIKKKVVVGKGFQNVNRIEKMADSTTELIYSPTAEEMKNVMINSDIAVSAAGQTLGELARVGVPAIAIGIADNQINNVRGWSNVGCIEYAGWHDDTYLREKLLSCIASLSHIEVRLAKSSIGQGLVDGMGSLRIVDHILDQVRH